MYRLPLNALQTAIYDRLTARVSTVTTYCPVAPNDATLPYIVITDFSCTDASDKMSTTLDCGYAVQIFTDAEMSFQSLHTLVGSVHVALLSKRLTLADNFQEVYSALTSVDIGTVQDDSGLRQQATLQIRSTIVDDT